MNEHIVLSIPHKVQHEFTVMSYNVLAQNLVQRSVFPYCGKDVLKWKLRSNKVFNKINEHEADILCLQEVDNYEEFYEDKLKMLGYDIIYYKNEDKKHGCCICFKKENWFLQSKEFIEFDNEMQDIAPSTIRTGNVALLITLRNTHGKSILVTNCHLFWRPDFDYERMRQAFILMTKIKEFNKDGYPVVMCGDFNSQPYKIVYKSIAQLPFDKVVFDRMVNELNLSVDNAKIELETIENKLKSENEELLSKQYVVEQENVDEAVKKVAQKDVARLTKSIANYYSDILDLKFRIANKDKLLNPQQLYDNLMNLPKFNSCYKDYTQYDTSYASEIWGSYSNEPKFTNVTQEFKSTLDYIFLKEGKEERLIATKLLKLPECEGLMGGLPNEIHPSDHLPIMVEMGWKI